MRAWLAAGLALVAAGAAASAEIRLGQMDLTAMTSGWGKAQADQSVTGTVLSMGGQKYGNGVGTHAPSEFAIRLDGRAKRFRASVGVDDNAVGGKSSLEFFVYGDDRELWRSGVMTRGDTARQVDVDLSGVQILELSVGDARDGYGFDHADWADSVVEFEGDALEALKPEPPDMSPVLLTPPAPRTPRINSPTVYAARPGSPLLYRIPCTGERPMRFQAQGLPEGLRLDERTGIISGITPKAGTYAIRLSAANRLGSDRRELELVVGSKLALTPPMGWNSWYILYWNVTDLDMREAADAMVSSGMADYGYQYVNIDDCWAVKPSSDDPELGGAARTVAGQVQPNKRFPDMKELTGYIHSLGLKAGIYTSPGPLTCAGFEGSYLHEAADARTFADWGFDFLKYDWCSYRKIETGRERDDLKAPYEKMFSFVQDLHRDMVFNLCQYGMGEVWKWGADVGHCWRTTGDLGAVAHGRLPGFYSIAFSNARHWRYGGPGHWNDPDYILIGRIGRPAQGDSVSAGLTPHEQYSYMSLWCLMAAPLIFSGDMGALDEQTLNVLCNHEVIEVDQDPLGHQGRIVRENRNEYVLAKKLSDGSVAVGLFNLSNRPRKMSVTLGEVGAGGQARVRDLWRQKDIGRMSGSYSCDVPRHGVSFVRMWRAEVR